MNIRPRVWTPEEEQWLRDNYPTKSDISCRKYLHVSRHHMMLKVQELGLIKKRNPQYSLIPVKKRQCVWLDENSSGGYCMNCTDYVSGGTCCNGGKEVGALWQKRCFKGEA